MANEIERQDYVGIKHFIEFSTLCQLKAKPLTSFFASLFRCFMYKIIFVNIRGFKNSPF